MIRKLITIVLPLLTPAVLYMAWTWVRRRRPADGEEGVDPFSWREMPWAWLGVAGAALVAANLIVSALFLQEEPGSRYEPPRFEEGKRIPGRFVR